MVGVDLGTRIMKVNISKIRKDHNPVEDVDVPLDPAALASAANAAKDACTATSKSTTHWGSAHSMHCGGCLLCLDSSRQREIIIGNRHGD